MDQELRAKLAVAHAQQDWTTYAVLRAKIDEASCARLRAKDYATPPYESGEIWTSGKCPGPGFELKTIIHLGESQCQGLHKWVKPAIGD